MSRDCVFCRIVRKEEGAQTVYEDERTLAFLDSHPLADGHTLVIPKAHYERLEDVPLPEVGAVFQTVHKVSRAVREALDASATTIGIHNGPAAGQVVPHLHVHIIPRRSGDGGGTIHSVIRCATGRDLGTVREALATTLQAA